MSHSIAPRQIFLHPGYVCVPAEECVLCAIASSGVVCTMYDERRKRGGMGFFAYPLRQKNRPSTALYAGPALYSLFHLLEQEGSLREDLSAFLFGGAENPSAQGYCPGLAEANARTGRELLEKLGVTISGSDLGGRWGRKIAFNSSTGETLSARTEKIRDTDWYPSYP